MEALGRLRKNGRAMFCRRSKGTILLRMQGGGERCARLTMTNLSAVSLLGHSGSRVVAIVHCIGAQWEERFGWDVGTSGRTLVEIAAGTSRIGSRSEECAWDILDVKRLHSAQSCRVAMGMLKGH